MSYTAEEQQFRDSIDCNFPYADRLQAEHLIDKASKISSGSMFAVIYELCYPGGANPAGKYQQERMSLLKFAAEKFSHPLRQLVVDTAERVIKGDELSVKEATKGMQEIAKYPGEYDCLEILYLSCDDKNNVADDLYTKIKARWHELPEDAAPMGRKNL